MDAQRGGKISGYVQQPFVTDDAGVVDDYIDGAEGINAVLRIDFAPGRR
jgi:hypothetical protein